MRTTRKTGTEIAGAVLTHVAVAWLLAAAVEHADPKRRRRP